MTQTVVTVWCEWEIGVEGAVYSDMEEAVEDARICLINCDIEETVEELENEGLIVFDSKTVDGDKRYHIVGDDSGHDYAIPVDNTDEWYVWMDSPEADAGDEPPKWAIKIEGDFTFTNPEG